MVQYNTVWGWHTFNTPAPLLQELGLNNKLHTRDSRNIDNRNIDSRNIDSRNILNAYSQS